jgi:altronate dehydratase large subunit
MSFKGYVREDGSVGIRNYFGVLATVVCANDIVAAISARSETCVPFMHGQGCCQTKPDLDRVKKTLINLGRNPNLAAVIVVGLGCESMNIEEIQAGISESGKPVYSVSARDHGGVGNAVSEAHKIISKLESALKSAERVECPDSQLVVGIKCGASDTTSGIIANPVTGKLADIIVDSGGTCVFGETTEFIGAEHILAERARDYAIEKRIYEFVKRMEQRAIAVGYDMRGGQPAGGNIKGGITTIEEKSLGAISKSGSRKIDDIREYGDRITRKGLYAVDSPGREPELLTGLAAAGCQVIIFTTGLGTPHGFPFVPVIKTTANRKTYVNLPEYIDVFLNMDGPQKTDNLGKMGVRLYEELLRVANGSQTRSEIMKYGLFTNNIYVLGPTL